MKITALYKRTYFFIAFLSFIFLIIFYSNATYLESLVNNLVYFHLSEDVLLGIFSLSVLLFYKLLIEKYEGNEFLNLLWKCTLTGLLLLVVLAVGNLYLKYFYESKSFDETPKMVYLAILVCIFLFFASCFYVFKKMILYHKTKTTVYLFDAIEYITFGNIFLNFIELKNDSIYFYLLLFPSAVLSIPLALNLKWIAYLDFKQKLNSIFFIAVILVINALVFWSIYKFSTKYQPDLDLMNNIFIVSILFFISIYGFFSVLVLFFNLPTSSVFEKKFSEVLNFQKLSRSAQEGKTEDEVYELLVTSCMGSMMANACVLELTEDTNEDKTNIYQEISRKDFDKIKTLLTENHKSAQDNYVMIDELNKEKNYGQIAHTGFKSLIALPLIAYKEKLGTIYLFSELKKGFEKEMIELVNTYVIQASTSVSNFRLINDAIENARYKQEIDIAKKVQNDLLPKEIISNDHLEMSIFSHSPDIVGGDYYDWVQIEKDKYAFVIGDVSGSGTSAAFHTAKLKGIFHSLIRTPISVKDFMIYANQAVTACLNKSNFITLTLLIIDLKTNSLETVRAGHCPTLHYDSKQKTVSFINQRGVGLGIIRNDGFKNAISKEEIQLNCGDVILVFTDGVIEAKNTLGEEFGYERIQQVLESNAEASTDTIKDCVLENLLSHSQNLPIDDDYSLMVLKIK
jgi:phosphoserine phosphatase RsbU/P